MADMEREVVLAEMYLQANVNKARAIATIHRDDWQNIIVAVDNSLIFDPHLNDEIVNAVVKFNTPIYKHCQVDTERDTDNGYIDIHIEVHCSGIRVLSGEIYPTTESAYLGSLESPDGYGSGKDILGLFEAMARFLDIKKITIDQDESALQLFRGEERNENMKIRSTVIMTLLSGEFNSYYHKLGYLYRTEEEDADVKAAAKRLLAMTVVDDKFSSYKFGNTNKSNHRRG
jgi:hypothetical protein